MGLRGAARGVKAVGARQVAGVLRRGRQDRHLLPCPSTRQPERTGPPRRGSCTVCLVAGWMGWSGSNSGFRDDSNPPHVWLALLGWVGSNP